MSKKAVQTERQCFLCNESFLTKNRASYFCSRKCQNINYKIRNRERINELARLRYNPEKEKEKKKKNYLKNKDKILEKNKEYAQKNRERINKIKAKNYYKYKKTDKFYYLTNPKYRDNNPFFFPCI